MFSSNKKITEASVMQALSSVQEPELGGNLVSLDLVRSVTIDDGRVAVSVALATPQHPLREQLERDIVSAIQRDLSAEQVDVRFDATVHADERIGARLNIPVKNIIAVASGKGGVGKSTVSTNLAASLALEGARAGVLDADIYGPNIPIMFGVEGRPRVQDGKMVPFERHGVQLISMGFLMPEGEAVIWRGPMLHKAIQQLFVDVLWGEVDYLIVDLPPGTGDAQLSLAQSVPLTGGVIVTGPQEVAVADARRGASAFQRLEVPILGVIENMSGEIFGAGGGQRAAQMMGVEYLGDVTLDARVRSGGDSGDPIVIAAPDSEAAQSLRRLARIVAARANAMHVEPEPELTII